MRKGNTLPIVLHTGHNLTKEEKRQRMEQEDIYRVGRLRLVPPDELSDRAKLHFQQIVASAFWLDELSADLLAAYCVAYDKFLNVVADMDGQAETFITKTKNGRVAKQNPNRQALRNYTDMLCQLSAKLGLGNIDRLRLSMQQEEKKEENPFEMFMENSFDMDKEMVN